MDLKAFIDDKDAVSPVIGVILMVAITVILAAVIGTFVLGLGDQVQDTSPNSQWEFDYSNDYEANTDNHDTLKMTHNGGDAINGDRLSAVVSGARYYDSTNAVLASDTKDSDVFTAGEYNAGSSETLGPTHFTNAATGANGEELNLEQATVRIVWESEGGDQSSTIRTWNGPDA